MVGGAQSAAITCLSVSDENGVNCVKLAARRRGAGYGQRPCLRLEPPGVLPMSQMPKPQYTRAFGSIYSTSSVSV